MLVSFFTAYLSLFFNNIPPVAQSELNYFYVHPEKLLKKYA